MKIHDELLLLNEQDVSKLLTPKDAIAAAEDTFLHAGLGDITVGEMALLYADFQNKNSFHSMPAVLHHRNYAGVKWISTFAAPLPGYPFSHGNLIILSDIATGSPVALIGATNITTMRTAGGHGVVQAKYLCNPKPKVLTIFGCGSQARAGIKGFLKQFPTLKQIRLFSLSRAPMEKVKNELFGKVEVVICGSPAEAVSGSNLILMASGSESILVSAEMIKPGTTIIGLEGFRDLDPRIGKLADKWYLGYRKPDAYIIHSPKLNPGNYLSIEDVFGDMTEVLTGNIPGREREDEIIVSTHMGMGAHDVNCAATIYERAREKNIGQHFPLNML